MREKFFTKKQFARKTFHGFSLVELLVSMAIIAVLLGLVGFGIATAQRNSRDSQRRQTVSDIKLALEDYLIRENSYPEVSDFCTNGDDEIGLNLSGGSDSITIGVSGPTIAESDTTSSATRYCYDQVGQGGYKLGALLENNEWYDASATVVGDEADENCADPFANAGACN